MEAVVPLGLFSGTPVLVTGADGRVKSCNRAAADLLGCRLPLPPDARCWDLVGLRCPGGEAFCRPECPVRGLARRGRLRPRHSVLLPRKGGESLPLELLTFAANTAGDGSAVIHVILPGGKAAPQAKAPDPIGPSPNRLDQLTRREREILRLLASGIGTSEVAATLCISPTTVRNHIQKLLRKLLGSAHSQL